MGKQKKRGFNNEDSDIRIYPGPTGSRKAKLCGAFDTQAVTDSTNRFEQTNVVKPSDLHVEENREWVNENKK